MKIKEVAQFAETITSPEFVHAKNETWEHLDHDGTDDLEAYYGQLGVAEDVHVQALEHGAGNVTPEWDAQRRAALASLGGTALKADGPFIAYFARLHGEARPSDLDIDNLDLGRRGPVGTNSEIKALYGDYPPAPEFFDRALTVISDRNRRQKDAIGPENYATSLKYFADLAMGQRTAFSAEEQEKARGMMESWAGGFAAVAKKDNPNFVEMTNIYVATRLLPQKVFPPQFTQTVVEHSLEQLPTYSRATNLTLLGAIPKLDPDVAPVQTAMLTDLSLGMIGQFEKTAEVRSSLRAVRALKPSEATHNALRRILQNNSTAELVEVQNIQELKDTVRSMRGIVEDAITDPNLSQQVRILAERCAIKAIRQYNAKTKDPALAMTSEEIQKLRSEVDRIVDDFGSI